MRRRGTRRGLVLAYRPAAQFSGAAGLRGPYREGPCGAGSCCPRAHSGLGAHS